MTLARRSLGILPLIVALVSAPVSAQMVVGVDAGLSSATLEGDDAATAGLDESRTAFNVGAWVQIPISDLLAFQPGLYYVEKGASDGDLDLKLNYVEFPLLLNLSLYETDALSFSLFGGPSVAFEVQCFREVSFINEGEPDTGSVECESLDEPIETKSVDVGGVLGAGVAVPVADGLAFTIAGGIDYGFVEIDDAAEPTDVRNRAFFVNGGFSWLLGG